MSYLPLIELMERPAITSSADISRRRHKGNAESNAVFQRVAEYLPQSRQRVLDFIREQGTNGATAQECANALGLPIHKVSPRFSELKRDGQIVKIGVRNDGGVCVVVELVEEVAA